MNAIQQLPDLGLGLGLRHQHIPYILQHWPEVDWFELISENYLNTQGKHRYYLDQIAEQYPVVMHGVSLSIGSTAPLDMNYLRQLKQLAGELQPAWVSDHLCWTGVLGLNTHDLLPVPLTEESLQHMIARVKQVQDYLERPLILENPSTYLSFNQSTLTDWEFLSELSEATDCGLLLDVNNVFVSSFNNDLDPIAYVEGLPHERIVQMHIAGHQHCGDHIIDTHDSEVIDQVWQLFSLAWQRTGGTSVLLEWDSDIPPFEVYHQELLKAQEHMKRMPPATIDMRAPSEVHAAGVSNPITHLVDAIQLEDAGVQTIK